MEAPQVHQRCCSAPEEIIAKYEAREQVTAFRMSQAQIIFCVHGTEP